MSVVVWQDRRDARKYVTQMLKAGFIKHTVNKTTFSEQCYYTFCDDKFLAGSEFRSLSKLLKLIIEPKIIRLGTPAFSSEYEFQLGDRKHTNKI